MIPASYTPTVITPTATTGLPLPGIRDIWMLPASVIGEWWEEKALCGITPHLISDTAVFGNAVRHGEHRLNARNRLEELVLEILKSFSLDIYSNVYGILYLLADKL